MLTIYRSNRAEVLAQLLAAQLSHPPPGPLEPVQVMVNTWPMSRWLGETLALHLDGIAAHLRFPFPGAHLRRVVLLFEGVGQGTEREAEADPWRATHLVWPVLEELPAIAASAEGELLRLWLGSRPDGTSVDLSLWQLARAIADAFDDYALYRPEVLGHWQAARDLGATGQPLPPRQLWQPKLYRRLRERLGVNPFGLRVAEAIQRLRTGEVDGARLKRQLGERLRLFGPSSMAPIQVQLLQAVAARLPVDLYLLTPCPGLWQRCIARRQALSEALALRQPLEGEWMRAAPPLEARFGRLGAEFHQLLEGTGEAQLSEERDEPLFVRPTRLPSAEGVSGEGPTLLRQLQEHLLGEEGAATLQRHERDHSLEFHACPGRFRQVQIVRDRVLQLLAADPSLEPRHILVMTPSVEDYAPLVAAVFGDGDATGVDLPWRLTDRSQEALGGVGQTMLELLALAADRLTATGLDRLLASPALQRRFGLSAEEAEGVTDLLQTLGFRWGLAAADRRGDATHSLGWAIDRLLLGLVLPEPEGDWEGTTAPARPPANLDGAGRVLHLLLRLRHWLGELAQPCASEAWLERLAAVLSDLFGGDTSNAPEFASLSRALEDWRLSAGANDLPLEPAVVSAILKEGLAKDSGRFGHRSGALTISALEPMRAIPQRVLILMGLDGDGFPRQRQRPGFHLLEAERQLGDPDPADQDRYALLEALLSARDHLLITWNGRDERTGLEKPPAAPVQQWLEWLRSRLPAGAAEGLLARHDPNPLAPENFLPQGARPPASCDRRLLEACRQLEAQRPQPLWGLASGGRAPAILEPLAPGDRDDELRNWLREPQREWLRELGMVARERHDAVDDLEDLELDERARSALLREALDQGSEGEPAWLERHRGEGRFPPAQGAALEAEILRQRWQSLRDVLESLGEERPMAAWRDRWSGALGLRGDAAVLIQPSRDRAAHRLDLWLRLQLAVAALGEAAPRRGVLIARGSSARKDAFSIQLTFQAPDPDQARRELDRLWQLRQAWRSACWPVPPETGWAWVENGGPAPGTAAFTAVAEVWEGNWRNGGEGEREEMRLCFGPERPLLSLIEEFPFQSEAQNLFDPIVAAIVQASPTKRSAAAREDSH
ncbi:MAG: exodeoxyribonuclease V subunit gamma [Cyanobacteriota bacterium]|nr:exodeoxyribonuclease V subunit gamma [Cyanobacteriota bacterium]